MASMLRSTANSSTGEASDKESIKIVNGKDEKDRHATKISVEILKKEHVYVDANNNNNNSRMIHEFKKTVNNNDLESSPKQINCEMSFGRKRNRLRGRIETAKQIDHNFDEKEKGSNDLLLDAEEFQALNALKSFLNIPALSLGLVNPVEGADDLNDIDCSKQLPE